MGLYLNPRGTPVGIDHFCIGLRDFSDDTALSTLKQQSMDAQKAVNGCRNPIPGPRPDQSRAGPGELPESDSRTAEGTTTAGAVSVPAGRVESRHAPGRQSGESHEVLRVALWAVVRWPAGTDHYLPAGDGSTRIDQLRGEPGWRGSLLCVGRRV